MEINPLNNNTLKNPIMACPMPPSTVRGYPTSYSLPKRNWISDNRLLLYYLISGITGLILVNIAIFIQPAVFIEEITTMTGSTFSIQMYTIVSSPIPFVISFGIGVTAAMLIPLAEHHSFRHRFFGAVPFAILYSIAFIIDMINTNMLFSIIAPMYGYTPPHPMLLWLTNPWLFLLMNSTIIIAFGSISTTIILLTAYFGEFLWTSLRGPLHIDPKIRRTAVVLRGHSRGTVLSINHKGGYLRGFARPSKWQGYDRED